MSGKEQRLEELLDQYTQRTTTASEEQELMLLLADPELAGKRGELIERMYDRLPSEFTLTNDQAEVIFNNITIQPTSHKSPAPVVKMDWKRWAAAASVILTLGVGAYIFFNYTGKGKQIAKDIKTAPQDIKAPATNRAMITLSNGQTVYLDSAVNGKLLEQNGVAIVKLADGKIAYTGTTTEVSYNTLSNPRGSRVIDMALADGSHVWLNAGSSVTFPLAFVGKERKVSITGEAYFEVAKNVAMPFRVDVAGKCEVEVLGTHFNVNAYSDEASINTTLLEGSVKVTSISTQDSKFIEPGQQVQLHTNARLILNNKANLDQVMAWKNGILSFDEADLQMVLRQLARWYDIDIVYEGEIPHREFAGEMQSDLNLSQMLRILETNNVHFVIDGKKLIVRK